MKIICIGRNYIDHAKEMKNDIPTKPVFFFKPDSSLVVNNKPFFLPDFSKEIQYETEVVVKISRLGKYITERFAHRYYNEITLGIDFTARDLQRECIEKGLPWEIAKGFDQSAVIGKFINKESYPEIQNIDFHLSINEKTVQSGNTKDMIFSIDKIISYVSQFVSLKIGDLIFTGTPSGVGPVFINDQLKATISNDLVLDFKIK